MRAAELIIPHRQRRRGALLLAGALVLSLVSAVPASAGSVRHDGVVSSNPVNWSPNALNGRVYAIEQVGDRVIVGGSFTEYEEAGGGPVSTRPYLFAFDAQTGAIDHAFDPVLDDTVQAIEAAPDGASVFVGGQFRNVNGSDHRNLVKLDLATGDVVTSFVARPDRKVLDLAMGVDRLFLAGTFGAVNGDARTVVAAVDATTGQVDEDFDLTFSGVYGGRDGVGTLAVQKIALTPDATRLVAIGNFNTVEGRSRHQVALLDVAARPAAVADWHTTRFHQSLCNSVFDTYMRNVDISPDGAYMAIVTTGAYRRDRLCDTVSRWDLDETGTNLEPAWVNWVGGDTLYGVEATGSAVYIGGHHRWVNNPFAGDAAGPGAVPREGLAALDPRNGMPLTWDPGRARGVGVFDMLATEAGLWMGSDTDRWSWEYHGRLAMFPGGTGGALPAADPGPLPGQLFRAPTRILSPDDVPQLYRVNTGGGTISAGDYGLDWAADTGGSSPYRVSGSNSASWPAVAAVDGSVPAATPHDVFATERWDPGSAPEMEWDFPVPAGREIEVRLYLASRCSCTDDPGERVFDVALDGDVVLDDYDIVDDVGHGVGTMKAWTIVSDGNVDLDFGHVVENPLVNAIEIIDVERQASWEPPPPLPLEGRSFDGAALGPVAEVSSDDDWASARGSFMLSGRLYTAWADGSMTSQPFDGATLGPATDVDLYGLTSAEFPVSNVSGMSFDPGTGRLYYTVRDVDTLFYRYFQPESETVGANTFSVVGNTAGIDWGSVRGLHLDVENGVVYLGNEDGNLRSAAFTDGLPVDGTLTTLSGPDTGDGETWRSRGLFTFAPSGYEAPNLLPEPNVTATCNGLDCIFGSTGSDDADGSVVDFAWTFDDGATASGPRAEHTFAAGGTHEVTLTVTDDEGGTASVAIPVEVTLLTPTIDAQCIDRTCTVDGSGSADTGGTVVAYEWTFGDGATATGPTAEHTYAGLGPYTIRLTVTDTNGITSTVTRSVRLDDAPAAIDLLDVSSATGNLPGFEVQVPDSVRGGDSLLLFVSVNKASTGTAAPVGVDGWTQLDSVVAGNLRTTAWHKIAEPGDEGRTVAVGVDGYTKGDVVLLAYEGTSTTTPVAVYEGASETTYQAAHTTPVVTNPADGSWVLSYWADRTSNTSDWDEPDGHLVRHEAFGPGPGRVSALVTDTGTGVGPGAIGGLTATANESNNSATMWTIALAPRGYDGAGTTEPVAVAQADCDGLECAFDGSLSVGGEGDIVAHDWEFSDGTTATGPTVQQTFPAEGSVQATLTVTDEGGGQATDTVSVEVSAPPTASFATTCGELTCQFDATGSSDVSGTVESWSWTFGDSGSADGAVVEHTFPAAGTYTVGLTVEDDEGDTASATADVTVSDQVADDIEFVGASGTNGNATEFTVPVPDGTVGGDLLLLVASANQTDRLPDSPTGEVAGWTLLDSVTAGSMQTRVWYAVADATDPSASVTVPVASTTKADVALLTYSGTHATTPVHAFSGVAESVYRAEHTTPTVVSTVDDGWVVSYWADKTSGTTSWQTPADQTIRHESYGSGGGRISAVATDHGPLPADTYGGLTAVANETNHKATMWTLVLAPAS